jgi:hypothetical protein
LASRSDDAHNSSVASIDAPLTSSPSAKRSNASGQKKCSCNASAQRLGVPHFEAVSVGHGRSSFAEQLAEKAVVI